MASSIRGSGSRRWGSSEVAAEIASLSPTASTALPLRWLRALRTLLARKPVAGVSALILLAFGLAALLAPLLAPYPPNLNSVGPTLEGPALGYPAGTDQFGRDMLSRLMFGGRVSLSIAAVGSTLSILGGAADRSHERLLRRRPGLHAAAPRGHGAGHPRAGAAAYGDRAYGLELAEPSCWRLAGSSRSASRAWSAAPSCR